MGQIMELTLILGIILMVEGDFYRILIVIIMCTKWRVVLIITLEVMDKVIIITPKDLIT